MNKDAMWVGLLLLLTWPAALQAESGPYTQGQWQQEWRPWLAGELGVAMTLNGSYWMLQQSELSPFSLVPGLVYEGRQPGLRPLAYAGVGPVWRYQGGPGLRPLPGGLQFNPRVGLGMAMGRHSLALEAWHLSSGGVKKPSDGLTSYGLSYRYRFD